MRCEIPTPKRCCFCFPLRIGLLVTGYIKFILSALTMLYISVNLYFIFQVVEFSEYYVSILFNLFSFFNSTVDVVFHLIFLIGAHKKDYRKIRMYYRYSFYNIIAITVIFILDMTLYVNILIIFLLYKYFIYLLFMYLWSLVIQIYLMILVRSEFLKLKGDTQFQFVNNEAEAQCSATIKISEEPNENNYNKISV